MSNEKIQLGPKYTCKFCGSDELDISDGSYSDGTACFNVVCLECGAEGPLAPSMKKACDRWDKTVECRPIGKSATAPLSDAQREEAARKAKKNYFFGCAESALLPGA